MNLVKLLSTESIPKELAFPEGEYIERLRRVRAGMESDNLDVLLVTSMPNLAYLTGYHTVAPNSYAICVVPRIGQLLLHLPEMEAPCALLSTNVTDLVTDGTWGSYLDAISHLAQVLAERGYHNKRIGVEARKAATFGAATIDGASYSHLKKCLPEAEISDATSIVLDLRLIKSPAELVQIRRAGEMTWKGIEAALAVAAPGKTDSELVAAAYTATIKAGSDRLCNQPMVLTGRRTGWGPHVPNKQVVLNVGDPIHIETSGCSNHYNAPMMRAASLGNPPAQVRQLADVSCAVMEILLESLRAERTAHDVATAAKKPFSSMGDQLHFFGSFGYSVGLSVPPGWTTEAPWYIAEGNHRPLEVGMVFHLIAAAMMPGRCRIAFSETVTVTQSGYELLTSGIGRELSVCG